MSSKYFLNKSLLNIYKKQIKVIKVCNSVNYIRSINIFNKQKIIYNQTNLSEFIENKCIENNKREIIISEQDYLTRIINDLEFVLKTNCKIIESYININVVDIYMKSSSGILDLLSYSTLTKLTFLDTLYGLRLLNEIIEDDINNFIRDILSNEIKNPIENSITPQFKSDIIKVRDTYKSIIPNEVFYENLDKTSENEDNKFLHKIFTDKIVLEAKKQTDNLLVLAYNKLL
jgi:hypothetical protein